jgi:site-specific DNA recombinase
VLYATGNFALSDLAAVLEAEGLRTNATRKLPEQRVGANRLSTILRNDYYLGIVRYSGKAYPGRHDHLVDEATFERVQDVLELQRHAGERSWKHHHYLVGTVFCAECGSRLIYSRNRGRSGALYDYFFCINRRDGSCSQPHHRVDAVDAAVEDYYATVQLTETSRTAIGHAARQRLSTIGERSGVEVARAERALTGLRAQEKKLLSAHYADAISAEIFADEQQRLHRERIAAEATIARLGRDFESAEKNLDLALGLTDELQQTYERADDEQRRLFNQGIFERIEIDRERVDSATLASPFAEVLAGDREVAGDLSALLDPNDDAWAAPNKEAAEPALVGAAGPGKAKNPGLFPKDLGSNLQSLVPLPGFEPGFPP